jgi:hypothetical protein
VTEKTSQRGDGEARPDEPTTPKLLTREQLRRFLNAEGYPITKSQLEKLGMPACGEGPPIAGYWGRSPLHKQEDALAWAQGRMRPEPYSIHPEATKRKRATAASAARRQVRRGSPRG